MNRNDDTMSSTRSAIKGKRIDELDMLKCLFILLMIAFHLAYFGDGHPYVKNFVYTFHMPGFLLISGYLMNVDKPVRAFARTLLWLLVPYVVMESGYVVMASVLPIRDHISELSPAVFLSKLFLHPLGPYWYLHTLIICGAIYYATFRWIRLSTLSRFIIIGMAFYGLSVAGLVSAGCVLYFLLGAVVRQSRQPFLSIFHGSWLAAVPLLVLFLSPSCFNRESLGGMLIVYLTISLALAAFPYIRRSRRLWLFLGRNSLVLYIFSPLFTICCKAFIPFLAFDGTRMLFLLVSLPVCVGGSLAVARLLDIVHLSPLLFGRKRSLI